jgi:hypothetical protein
MKRFSLLLLAAACGSSAPPRHASVTGSVAGTPFAGSDSAAVIVRHSAPPIIDVLVTNLPDSCAGNDANVKAKQVLHLAVSTTAAGLDGGNYAVLDTSQRTLPSGNYAIVEFDTTTTGCAPNNPPNNSGASGRVTLSRVDMDGGVAGDFDVILQSGDRLKGTFDAPVCPTKPANDAGCH